MPYTPPTLAELRTKVGRDLRDPDLDTFSAEDVLDFINFGIAEVNRVIPKETVVDLDITDTEQTEYDIDLTLVWRVEVWRSDQSFHTIHANRNENSRGGWEVFGQSLYIPDYRNVLDVDTDVLRVWGYIDRDPLEDDDDVADFLSLDDELGVRAFAAVQGYQRLVADRSLFQQWQTQANNSDVSPTQLTGMLGFRQSEWDSLRKRIRRLPRTG